MLFLNMSHFYPHVLREILHSIFQPLYEFDAREELDSFMNPGFDWNYAPALYLLVGNHRDYQVNNVSLFPTFTKLLI